MRNPRSRLSGDLFPTQSTPCSLSARLLAGCVQVAPTERQSPKATKQGVLSALIVGSTIGVVISQSLSSGIGARSRWLAGFETAGFIGGVSFAVIAFFADGSCAWRRTRGRLTAPRIR
jgi:hypothetical protein